MSVTRLWKWRQIPALIFWLAVFAWRIRRRDWFRRFPFLPIPPGGYLRWRMELAYGPYPVGRGNRLIDIFNFAYALRQFERM
ncbi:MAG: hypothetical protein HYT87_00145 [Nitrospirae bacterium]|nr:hypothetical protein [Nitrospirota bacterium]